MNVPHQFRRGFALVFVLFLLLNSIALIGDGISIGSAMTGLAVSIGIVIADEALWRAMRPRS